MTNNEIEQSPEAFTLKGKGEIMEKLRVMEKSKTLLTVEPKRGGGGMATTIVRLVAEKGFIALDPSPDASVNQRLLGAGTLLFAAQVNGVETQFSVDKLIDARLQGQTVLAAPIPTAMFWLQRRKLYRITVPRYMGVKCRMPLPNEQLAEFPVLNVSLTGLAILDKAGHFRMWGRVGHVFDDCRLYLSGFEDEIFSLELRNKLDTSIGNERDSGVRVGFEFKETSRSFEPKLQKFMYEAERELKTERP
jgi:c-di-GMP-binding flagellar brake protein YcgR